MLPVLPYLQFETKDNEVTITCDSQVDIENSEFIYDGQLLSDLSFTIQSQGTTYLVYCLKDEQGNILSQDSQSFFYDSIAPKIHCTINDFEIDNEIHLWDECELKINIDDISLTNTTIFVDDEIIEWEESIVLTKENKSLKIQCIDEYGNESEREISIIDDSFAISSNIDSEYTTTDFIEFNMDLSNKTIEEYIDGQLVEFNNQLTIPGYYQFILKDSNYPYLSKEINSFYFTNTKPYIQIMNTGSFNQSQTLLVQYNCPWIKEGWITVDGITYSLDDVIVLETNDIHQFLIQSYVIDCFGQQAYDEQIITIDMRPLQMNMTFNSQQVNQSSIYYMDCTQWNLETNRNAQIQYKINNQVIDDLSTYLNQANCDENIYCIIRIKDEFNQMLEKELMFYRLPKSISVTYQQPEQTQRVYEVKEKTVVLKQEVKKDTRAPIIKMVVNNGASKRPSLFDKIKIYIASNPDDSFSSIRINDKEIDLKEVKKDDLNHSYYEFTTIKPYYSIQVKAIDEAGNRTEKEMEYKISYPWFLLLILLPVIVLIRHHEKNSNLSK